MMQALGESLLAIMEQSGVMDAEVEARIATGLTRPDFFDWPGHLRREVLPSDPELVVVMFGANDAQGIQLPDGSVRRRFEQGWLDEYRRRVGEVMDLLRDPEGDRLVVWVGQPPMRPGTVAGVEKMNAIYWEEARERPWVVYFDSWPFLATTEGQYADYLPNAAGQAERVRKQDGIHLTREGADRLAAEIYERLTRLVDLSASQYSPPADDLAAVRRAGAYRATTPGPRADRVRLALESAGLRSHRGRRSHRGGACLQGRRRLSSVFGRRLHREIGG
ncbi:MAG: hypothetical protein KatS3mg008_1879 [Acidimicrobiales bacterium]|nr:MAG: hypothetical protein KatS3mg008_1879 [Acidimicrobiales bacterium]